MSELVVFSIKSLILSFLMQSAFLIPFTHILVLLKNKSLFLNHFIFSLSWLKRFLRLRRTLPSLFSLFIPSYSGLLLFKMDLGLFGFRSLSLFTPVKHTLSAFNFRDFSLFRLNLNHWFWDNLRLMIVRGFN